MIVNLQWEGCLLYNATAIGLLYERNGISIAHWPDVYLGVGNNVRERSAKGMLLYIETRSAGESEDPTAARFAVSAI